MSTSRQKILNYIIEQQSTTVEDLSKVFRVTPANIRHHLSILTEQGSVKVIGQKAVNFKGRPAQIYSSSQLSDQNNLDHLSDALLCTLVCNSGPNEKKQMIDNIALHIGAEFKVDFTNPTRRMYSTIHSLNRMNYQAHWEAHIKNPRIMLGHCPYYAILDEHPELCQVDASLLEHLLDTPVWQIEKQAINTKGIPQCVFLMNNPANAISKLYEE
jgi:predicted ArsR family transcriptional regulator